LIEFSILLGALLVKEHCSVVVVVVVVVVGSNVEGDKHHKTDGDPEVRFVR
jgi:hypothetical protein